MPPPALSILYTSQQDMEDFLSPLGVRVRADHDADGALSAAEQRAITYAVNGGTETILFYTYSRYDPAVLANSWSVNRWATYFACYQLCCERVDPIPETLITLIEDATTKLEQIQLGRHAGLPGIPVRRTQAPVWSNVRVDPLYQFKCIRVEKGRSSKGPNTRPVVPDYPEAFCPEY